MLMLMLVRAQQAKALLISSNCFDYQMVLSDDDLDGIVD